MMSKCAKFHEDIPSRYRLQTKLILASAIELSETASFWFNFVQKTDASAQLWWQIWPTFSLNIFYAVFTHDSFLSFLYHDAKKLKMPKSHSKGDTALAAHSCETFRDNGLCSLRHGIPISIEAILACHPARSTEWMDCHPKSYELWRIRTGPISAVSASSSGRQTINS